MKNRDKWITLVFLLFIVTLPAVTVIQSFLPQAEEVLDEEAQKVLDNNGTTQDGNRGDAQDTAMEEEPEQAAWFAKVQNSLISFTERLFLRSRIINYNTELTSLLTGGSYIESTQVLLGKENYLFYKTQLDGTPIYDYMGINYFSEQDLEKIANNLTQMRDYFTAEGIDFYLAGIPNKEVIYEQYMPDTIARVNEISRAEQVANYIWDNTDLLYIYPKDALIEASKKYQTYYKTDTHWNQIGAFVCFQEIYQEAFGMSEDVEDVEFVVADNQYAGDLAVIGGVSDKYKIDKAYIIDTESVNQDMKRDETILVIGDSFSGFLSTISKAYYSDVHWIYTSDFKMSMIEEYGADAIIFETVERYMETFRDVSLLNK